MKKVLLVADISNLYYCVKKRFGGRKIDYAKLLDFSLHAGEEYYRKIAYGSYSDESADRFIRLLESLGFEAKYKQVKIYPSAEGESRKADWDVGIAMDVVKILPNVDTVIFLTADGDMAACLEYVNFQGKMTRVIGSGVSRDLRETCHYWHEIEQTHLLPEVNNGIDQERESVGVRTGESCNADGPVASGTP